MKYFFILLTISFASLFAYSDPSLFFADHHKEYTLWRTRNVLNVDSILHQKIRVLSSDEVIALQALFENKENFLLYTKRCPFFADWAIAADKTDLMLICTTGKQIKIIQKEQVLFLDYDPIATQLHSLLGI